MKVASILLLIASLATLFCPALARAQLVPDGGFVTINNITTNLSTSLTIGTNGPNTGLAVVNQGKVFSAGGTIGQNALSANNAVSISGSGSQWGYGNSLIIGSSGPRNQFTIASGGLAFGQNGSIGSTAGSYSNVVLLINASSLWQVANIIRVGVGGQSNQLTVAGGATVADRIGYIGAGIGANHNVAHLTGAGSAWNNRELMVVGLFGRSNQLHIANSASVTSSDSVIGWERDASGNIALVSVGALWTNWGGLIVSSNSFYNQLVVSNGGKVFNTDFTVGYTPGGGTNRVVVTGPNSLLTNSGRLWLGFYSSSNSLTISNGGWVAAGEGVIGTQADAIARSLSSANHVLVQDIGSRFMLNVLRVGNAGTNNRLIIQKGGQVTAGALVELGGSFGANHNTVLVSDPASSLSIDRLFYVGSDSANNRLIITNGGRVSNGTFAYIGRLNSASNNSVLISDPGSLWATGDPLAPGWLYVGDGGPRNSLTVSNAATLSSADTFIGNESTSNTVLVTGPGSLWTNSGFVNVGYFGARNQLIISNGARLVSFGAYIGRLPAAQSNSVVLTGAGSVWTNSDELVVGFSGSQAQMTVANGAQVFSERAAVGLISNNNSVLITGPGSLWANNSTFDLGSEGSLNELSISNQAMLRVGSSLTLGAGSSSVDNLLGIYAGAGLWVTNAARNGLLDIRRGRLISGNQVQIITDKLLLTNGAASRFQFAGGVLQTAGTVVSNGAALVVGDGVDTPVFILNGGTHVFANGLTIASNATLRGCGTIHGPVINRGTIIADCPGQTLSFSGAFTNLGTGTIYSTNGGRLQFSAPLFAITRLTKTGATANVTFTTIKALRFTLEYKDSLTNPTWTSIPPSPTGDGTPLTLPDSNAAAPTRFYRPRGD